MPIFLIGCEPTANDIPLGEINQHRNYQDSKGKEFVKDEYIKLVNENPNSPEALYFLARCEFNKDEALKHLEKALNINPEFYYALLLKGYILSSKAQYENAVELYLTCIKIDYNNVMAHLNLGDLYYKIAESENNLERKLEKFKQALSEFNIVVTSSDVSKEAVMNVPIEEWVNELNSLINELNSLISNLETEIKEKEKERVKCKNLAGYYVGDIQMGYLYGYASIRIKEDCSCTYKYSVMMPSGRERGATEYGDLVDFKVMQPSNVSCELDCRPYGGKYPFSWNSSGLVMIDGFSQSAVLYKN